MNTDLFRLANYAERCFDSSAAKRQFATEMTAQKSRQLERQFVFVRRWRPYAFFAIALALTAVGVSEAISQNRESRYVRRMAQTITSQAQASDTMSTIVALRDYLRSNVSRKYYPAAGRPFLRATAAEALRTGKGRCGESTRAFINMAESLGIHAQRLYLEGQREHVVALVRVDGRQIIVDSDERPYFQELEDFSQLAQHPQFNYYSSINVHRLFRRVPLPANTAGLRGLSYFLENPHALKALFCFSLVSAGVALVVPRTARRRLRARRMTNRLVTEGMRSGPSPALATVDQ
jgi:hypothetical protein